MPRSILAARALAILAGAILLAPAPSSANPPDPADASIQQDALARIDAESPSLEALYRELHRNPELSFQEKETSARMAVELRAAGFEVTEGVGGYGVVAVLANGPGDTLLIRADMDALPVKELTELPYASEVVAEDGGAQVPVMHACGHDVHMTCLIGTARLLAGLRDRWSGTLVMIAQPAEERGGGARAMLADGLYTRFPRPDAAIALHVDSSLLAGSIGWTRGPAMANVDSVDIVIRGIGGHGAYPEAAKDPIVIAAQTILALQTIVSRETRANDPAVLTVGSIHAGTKHNIIPSEARMQLTVRSYSDEVRARMLASIERVTRGICQAAGVPAELAPIIEVKDEYTPALINDPVLTDRLVGLFARVFGADKIIEREAMMGGEDFGRFGRETPRVPILMFRLGSLSPAQMDLMSREGAIRPFLHSSFYHPDLAPTLRTGIRAMVSAALELLPPGAEANDESKARN